MAKYEPIGSCKYKCVCEVCGKVFYEKKSRKDIAKYCCKKCSNSKRINNLIGKRFGRLVVVSYEGIKNRYAHWKCKCDCGNETIVRGSHLLYGTTTSCGCYSKELATIHIKKVSITHNLSNSRLYGVYRSIKNRCYAKNCCEYKNYGGRGIKMCDEWKNDFMAFYDWAYANGYDENAKKGDCTIDRIDNNGNYEPNNCRWVSIKEQCRNKRTNVKLNYNGRDYLAIEISEIKKCSYGAIQWRIKNGWSVKDIFEVDIGQKRTATN